jgi:hypothetical protein
MESSIIVYLQDVTHCTGGNKCIQNYSCKILGYLVMESRTIINCTLDEQIKKVLTE